ncbi:MAG: phosphoesterase [Desulfobacteraceae bacterium]|nr:phosphoesterase [Desulfobacteraceae bacterium]
MRVLFVTDLHGSKWKYERLFEAAKDFKAKVVINGGDMLPQNEPFRQGEFITDYLDNHFAQFNSAGIYYLCYLGNDDLRIFDQRFEETCNKYSFVVCLAQRKFEVGGYEFAGMNWVVDYPFRLKDRCRMDTDDYIFQEQFGKGLLSTPNGWQETDDWFAHAKTLPTIEEELNRLVRPKDMAKSVYVIHMPPYSLGLDKCYHGAEVGSKAIYNFLEKYQPKLSLHGHIHESPEVTRPPRLSESDPPAIARHERAGGGQAGRWYAKLGRTICIQPGQLNEFTYVTIDLSAMKFDRIKEQYVT